MSTDVKAEVVNALLSPVLKVLKQCGDIDGHDPKLSLTSQLEFTPCVTITIELSGKVMGPVVCDFDSDLARALASKMLTSNTPVPLDSPECQDALAEIGNIIVGHATGALFDAGYDVQLSTPSACVRTEVTDLATRHIDYTVHTRYGRMSVLLGLQSDKR